MNEIVAAIIGAGASFIVATIGWLFEHQRAVQSERKVLAFEQATEVGATSSKNRLLNRFGFTRDFVRDERTIGQFWTTVGNTIDQPTFNLPLDFGKQLEPRIQAGPPHQCDFRVEILGGLVAKEVLNYSVGTTIRGGVKMTKEEADACYSLDAFKSEFVSYDVDYPLERLDLSVTFPEGYIVQCYTGVFLAHSECVHTREQLRMKNEGALVQLRNRATLSVSAPLLGFRYAIYWTPLEKRAFDALGTPPQQTKPAEN
jgi:hypothetical protein